MTAGRHPAFGVSIGVFVAALAWLASTAGPGGGASLPPPCASPVVSTESPTNMTPVPIPDAPGGPAVSTIVVSGLGGGLADVDVTTNVAHTFPADLDMTLTSPLGTIVTLTTDNGSSNDNVFAGTHWDDQADPGGAVPYFTNDGLVTDHAYATGVLASPLVPEEPLAAFEGENPNGTWTLTIVDDVAPETGTLTSWGLDLQTFSTAPETAPFSGAATTPVPIPDSGGPLATSTIAVSGARTSLTELIAVTNLTHTFPADLDMTLTSPAGTIVTLTSDNGGSIDAAFAGTRWDDRANPGGALPYTNNNGLATDHAYVAAALASPLAPEEALGAFDGENPNGTWTLAIDDDLGGETGTLSSWQLEGRAACPATTLRIGNASSGERNSGTRSVTVKVRLSRAAQEVVRVSYATANGSAKAGTDYKKASGVLFFQPGQLARSITVLVKGDRRDERNETFFVRLSKPSGATIGDGSGTVTIRDDD
jgi:subtilisin-like proprotein convertase family protein